MVKGQMGRPRQWAEDMQARFALGTFKRIAAVLGQDEDRTDFIRAAVERELRHREAAKKRRTEPRRAAPR
jgi:hypothetical protein